MLETTKAFPSEGSAFFPVKSKQGNYPFIKDHIQREFLSSNATLIKIFLDAVSSPENLSLKEAQLKRNLKSRGFSVVKKNNTDGRPMLVIWISEINMPRATGSASPGWYDDFDAASILEARKASSKREEACIIS